jgi:hypothetical protein
VVCVLTLFIYSVFPFSEATKKNIRGELCGAEVLSFNNASLEEASCKMTVVS